MTRRRAIFGAATIGVVVIVVALTTLFTSDAYETAKSAVATDVGVIQSVGSIGSISFLSERLGTSTARYRFEVRSPSGKQIIVTVELERATTWRVTRLNIEEP